MQEWFLIAGDMLTQVSRAWWYALGIAVVATIPVFYIFKYSFIQVLMRSYQPPQIIYTQAIQQPLQITDKKIFSLGGNSYSGFARIKNINLEWGTASQGYTVQFKTLGGTLITQVSGSTFILSASEKLLIFSRFTSDQKPEVILVTLSPTTFLLKPQVDISLNLERVNLQNGAGGTQVSAAITNLTAFTIKQINLPVVLYNNKNEIMGINFTYINDVLSGETRTFSYAWTNQVSGVVRAEITSEVNIFDRNVLTTEAGTSPFQNQ